MAAVLRKILPAHDDRSETRLVRNMMIDVLRGVRLVVHEKAAVPEPQILHQNDIGRQICRTLVSYLEMPQPDVLPRMQPQREAVMHATCQAVPYEAVIDGTEEDPGARAQDLGDVGGCSTGAHIDASDAAADRRAEYLVEHRAAAGPLVLDGGNAAIRQRADGKPSRILQTPQTEIPTAGGREGACASTRHAGGSSNSQQAVAG